MEPYQYQLLGMFLILVLIIVCIFLAWYFQHRARTRERIVLIEKGVDIEKLFGHGGHGWTPLNTAIILIGLGSVLGIYAIFMMIDDLNTVWVIENAAGEVIETNMTPSTGQKVLAMKGQHINDAAYPFVFFLCMGISFFIIHYLGRKKS